MIIDKTEIESMIKEEKEDARKYTAFADRCGEFKGVFRDIAKDEESHVKLLEYILQESLKGM